DDAPVDHPGAWLGVGERGDDRHLLGVRDDDTLVGVVVVGGAAQHGASLDDAHDAREGALGTRGVADDVDVVPDHDASAPELAGLHRDDGALVLAVGVHQERVAAPVHPGDHRTFGVGVVGSTLRARAAPAPARPVAEVALVEAVRHRPSISCHCAAKSGRVLAVVATFSTTTSGTRSPMIAPAVAMRWSW